MGADFDRIVKDLVRLMHEVTGSARATGEFIISIAAQRGVTLGPFNAKQVQMAINRLGGPGYGLIGEAVLQRVGLDYLFKPQEGRQDNGFQLYEGIYEKIRALLRTWIAERLPANQLYS
jgi:hypothetical protein